MSDYLTVEQMRNRIAHHIQQLASGGTLGASVSQRITEELDTVYSELVREYRWPGLVDAKETGVTATANERFFFLPKYVSQLYFVLPSVLDSIAPHQAVANFFQRNGFVSDSSGPIQTYTDAGEKGIKAVFSSTPEKVTVTMASGTDSVDVYLVGIVGDDTVRETVSIVNGVAGTSSNTFADLLSVSTNGQHTVRITVAGQTSLTTYATISPKERTVRYRRLRLWQVPTTAETVALYFKRRAIPLTDDDQVPEIPVSQVLIHRVAALEFSQQRKWSDAMRVHEALADRALESVIAEETVQGEHIEQGVPLIGRYRRRGSSLGTVVVNN